MSPGFTIRAFGPQPFFFPAACERDITRPAP
jgi:hypothetical protein